MKESRNLDSVILNTVKELPGERPAPVGFFSPQIGFRMTSSPYRSSSPPIMLMEPNVGTMSATSELLIISGIAAT